MHSSPAALFVSCNFFLLHIVHADLFPDVYPGPPQISKMESFATIIDKTVKYCYKNLHLRCSRRSWLRVYYFHVALFQCRTLHVALFSCCTVLISKNIENRRKTESTTKKTTWHSASWICFTFILISCYTFLSLYSFNSLWSEKKPIYSFVGKWCWLMLETFKIRMKIESSFSPR